jgi:hypothetical protein
VTGIPSPQGIALDSFGNEVYWSNYLGDEILRAMLDGTRIETLVSGVSANSIALDLAADALYWADFEGDWIGRSALDGSQREDLFRLSDPLAIAVDPIHRQLFVAASGLYMPLPEPSFYGLLLTGILSLALVGRRSAR